jgi:hypothetical protein
VLEATLIIFVLRWAILSRFCCIISWYSYISSIDISEWFTFFSIMLLDVEQNPGDVRENTLYFSALNILRWNYSLFVYFKKYSLHALIVLPVISHCRRLDLQLMTLINLPDAKVHLILSAQHGVVKYARGDDRIVKSDYTNSISLRSWVASAFCWKTVADFHNLLCWDKSRFFLLKYKL